MQQNYQARFCPETTGRMSHTVQSSSFPWFLNGSLKCQGWIMRKAGSKCTGLWLPSGNQGGNLESECKFQITHWQYLWVSFLDLAKAFEVLRRISREGQIRSQAQVPADLIMFMVLVCMGRWGYRKVIMRMQKQTRKGKGEGLGRSFKSTQVSDSRTPRSECPSDLSDVIFKISFLDYQSSIIQKFEDSGSRLSII